MLTLKLNCANILLYFRINSSEEERITNKTRHSAETEKLMEIINAHAHIYPEKIAEKATNTIGIFYDIKMQMPA